MGKKKKKLVTVNFEGTPLAKILSQTTPGGETLVKPLAQRDIHLSVYSSESEIKRHITHETRQGESRHTQRAGVRPEEVILLFLAALAPEDDPPPKVRSFADREECRVLGEWLARVWPKVSRKAEDRLVRVLKGPITNLAEIIDSALPGKFPDTFDVDLASFMEYYKSGVLDGDDEAFTTSRETDLAPGVAKVAFSEDLNKLIISVGEGAVVEVDPVRLRAATLEMSGLLGVFDLFQAIDREGLSLVDKDTLEALRQWRERHP
jgi:hypothetical protein